MQAHKPRTADQAIGRWPGILQALGVDSRHLSKKHGPCPVCQGKDRYRFDDKDGRGNWICSHCGSGDGFRLLQHMFGWSFSEAAKQVDRIVGAVPVGPIKPMRTEESKVRVLNHTWRSSRPVAKGDPAWLYLNRTRNLNIDMVPPDLRFHSALRYTDENGRNLGQFPAMLARLRYPDGSGVSIHRTYLTDTGKKRRSRRLRKSWLANR